MVSSEAIKTVCDEIVGQFHPHKVILFGSYAYGTPTPDSDVDLLVIMPFEGHPAEQAVKIGRGIRHRFALDLLVRTPEFVRQRVNHEDWFLREIVEKGKVLYETGYAGMGAKS